MSRGPVSGLLERLGGVIKVKEVKSVTLTLTGTIAAVAAALSGALTAASAAIAGTLTAKVVGSAAAVALTPGATPAINATLGKIFTMTPAQNQAFTVTGGIVGQELLLKILTSGTNSYDLTFGSGFGANGGTLATGTADAKTFVARFVHDGTSFVEVGRTAAM